uniref:Aminotransferase-like plant mobile domain-containing protein n=1 Tax=Oryza rufipogon TaxID=4529 RepID=A0A0E0NG94_ORYRU
MGLYQQVPIPVGLHLPPDVHMQKRQADSKYHRSMHSRMTPWIEAWSQALNDVVQETRAYDHNNYELYMAWYSSQTRIRLLAPKDPDKRGPPTIDQIYDMQLAPSTHLTILLPFKYFVASTDIAGELKRDAKTLWKKLRDGMAGTNQEVMAAVDSLRRKGKRIMRLASCRHSSDVYTPATSRRTFETMPERPSTSSRPSTSARPSASARRSSDGCAGVRGNVNGLSRASYASCKATNDSSNGSRCANLTLARRICTFCRAYSVGSTASTYIWHQLMARTIHGLRCTSFDGGVQGYMDLLQQGDWLFGQYSSHPNEIPYMQAPSTGSFRPEPMSGFRPYTASYGDMSSFGGGSSPATQPEVGEGNDNDPRRSNRERHEPNRMSLSGPRHAAGQRKKTTKKRGETSRTTTDHDDDDE